MVSFAGTGSRETDAPEGVDEDDGTRQLDPLVRLVHKEPTLSSRIYRYSHDYVKGEKGHAYCAQRMIRAM